MSANFLDRALALAALGKPVFPCRPLTEPDPRKRKAPYEAGGFKTATTDRAQIEAWAKRYPDALVGLPTGKASGLFVVDLDTKGGKDGPGNFMRLTESQAAHPTLEIKTASGGLHLYYLDPDGRGASTVARLGEGIDTRGEGGYVIAYPDVHVARAIAVAPDWLLDLAAAPVRRGITDPEADVQGFIVRDQDRRVPARAELEALARTLPSAVGADLAAVLSGRPWGEKGARDERLTSLCWWLVDKIPDLDPQGTSALFEVSCAAVEDEDGAVTVVSWVESKLAYAIRKVAGKHAREAAERDSAADAASYIARARAARGVPPEGPVFGLTFGREDLDAVARATRAAVSVSVHDLAAGKPLAPPQVEAVSGALARAALARGLELDAGATATALAPLLEVSGVSVDQAKAMFGAAADKARADADAAKHDHDWVVGTPQGYFLKAPDGYQGPFPTDLVPARARDVLDESGVTLMRFSRGEWAPKPTAALLHEYGTVPRSTEFTLVGETRLESDLLLYKALREPAILPEFNEEIATWLCLLAGGPGPLHEAFLDWLATFRQFERPTAAPFLRAWPGVGKGLLIDGLASLFAAAKAVPFGEAISPFNGMLALCPLVVADEGLTAPPGVNAVDELKKLVGDSAFRVADKNIRATTLRGCVRVVLTSNHHGGFKFGRELTEADVAALDQRVLMLAPGGQTADYLASIGGRAHTEAWVQGGGFARHVRYLEDARVVEPGSRFLVEGRGGLSTMLAGDSLGTAPVLRACVAAFMSGNASVVVKDDGQFWVHKKRLLEAWETLNKRDQIPSDMHAAWGLVCASPASTVYNEGGSVRRNRLRKELIFQTAEKMGFGQEAQDRYELVKAATKTS